MTRRRRDPGQATVELALALPLVCLLIFGIVQVAVVGRDQLAVQLAAREAARAAAASADPNAAGRAAALRAVALRPLAIDISESAGTVTATVRYTDDTSVPLIGALLPDVVLTASVTMAIEPPPAEAPTGAGNSPAAVRVHDLESISRSADTRRAGTKPRRHTQPSPLSDSHPGMFVGRLGWEQGWS